MSINKDISTTFKLFRKDFEEAVKGLEEKYEIKLSIGNISYTDIDFSTKLKGVFEKDGKDAQQVEFEKYCSIFGLKPEDYKKGIKTNEPFKEYILVGFNLKAKKYPYVALCLNDNKRYKLPKIELQH